MREIKFRAWDKANTIMLFFSFNENTSDYPVEFPENNLSENEGYVIMQYIGLKDKNGIEIYEGDIVRDRVLDIKTRKPEDVERTFEVYWDNKTASFWQKLINDPTHKFRSGTNFAAEKDCEVIGNIYENKELLGEG